MSIDKSERDLDWGKIPQGESDPDAEMVCNTNYAKQNTIYWSGDHLYGNWSTNFSAACINTSNRYIHRGSIIAGPTQVGGCNGEWICMLEHH